MENTIQTFNNDQFGTIRTIEENGKVLFCATDVAKALGYSNPRKAILDHCKSDGVTKRDGVSKTTNQYGVTTEQVTKMKFINEGNVYRLITHSKLPAAEQFERWVFDEVLPTIRKTGSYTITKEQAKAQLLLTIYDGGQEAVVASKKLSELEVEQATTPLLQKIEIDKPLVEFADHVSNTTSLIDIGNLQSLPKKNILTSAEIVSWSGFVRTVISWTHTGIKINLIKSTLNRAYSK